jgi:hypothetical protein
MYIKDNMKKVRNVKILLYIFEQMSGLKKINLEKSEILLIGEIIILL